MTTAINKVCIRWLLEHIHLVGEGSDASLVEGGLKFRWDKSEQIFGIGGLPPSSSAQ